MIYINNISDAQKLMIPRNGENATSDLSLVLIDTTDHRQIDIEVIDIHTSDLYYNIAVALPDDLSTGEYQYKLMTGQIVLSCGLMFIGDFKNTSCQYEETITYKQYGE